MDTIDKTRLLLEDADDSNDYHSSIKVRAKGYANNCLEKCLTSLERKVLRYTNNDFGRIQYGRQTLTSLIPCNVLVQYMDQCFGKDGWEAKIVSLNIRETSTGSSRVCSTFAEASVQVLIGDNLAQTVTGIGHAECTTDAKSASVEDALKRCILRFVM